MYGGAHSGVGLRGKMRRKVTFPPVDKEEEESTPSTSSSPPSRHSRRFVRASVYLYMLVMGLLFINQAWMSISKYLDREIVEDVSMTRNLTAVMPPLTFCLLPGYTKPMDIQAMQNFSHFCPDQPDIVRCIEEQMFNLSHLVISSFRYPGTDPPAMPPAENWHPNSFNLAAGSCFTHQKTLPEPYAQSWGDVLIFDLDNPNLSNGWTLVVYIHNPGGFVPSMGMAGEYMGQKYIGWTPTPSGLIQVTLGVTHRTLINSEMRPCEIDPEYSVVKCMEDYSTVTAGCKSPWDLHKNDSTRLCDSASDFERLFAVHSGIFTMGSLQFETKSGCLPPCSYMDFDTSVRSFTNPHVTALFGGTRIAGIALSLRSTNQRVAREAWLYQLHNLVGEIGGCLGMFLGVSLISLYQMSLGALENAFKYVQLK